MRKSRRLDGELDLNVSVELYFISTGILWYWGDMISFW